ncbi:hypothetical protein IID19_04840 [Patescibacteria group bacterium]|nr:hypothetical protein [Patescibacteria group bacterium]
MENLEIKKWMNEMRESGKSDNEIEIDLKQAGWDDNQILKLLKDGKKGIEPEKSLMKSFIFSLAAILLFGGVAYYFIFVLIAGFALAGDDEVMFNILIPVVLVVFTVFIWILYRFNKSNKGDKRVRKYLIVLILIVIISPVLAFYVIKISSDIGAKRLDKKVERSDQCEEELLASLLRVDDIRDSHNIGDSFILLELDIFAEKEVVLSFGNNAGVSYRGENFGTQLFRARWQREKPWTDNLRYSDEGKTYYETTIPQGNNSIGVTLDSVSGYADKEGYKNGKAVSGLQIDGPYQVFLGVRIMSEESRCLYDALDDDYGGTGYNPRVPLIKDGYTTSAYSWDDFE